MSPMSRYRAGYEFERDIKLHLESEGYWVIAARSSKGKIDLLALKTGQALFIQAKRDGKIGPAERAEVIRIAGLVNAGIPVVAWKQERNTTPQYRRLVGQGPGDWLPFSTDEVSS